MYPYYVAQVEIELSKQSVAEAHLLMNMETG